MCLEQCPDLQQGAVHGSPTAVEQHGAASLRFAENVPFTAAHAVNAMEWARVDRPVAHASGIAWQAVKAGDPLTVLSLEPELYSGTGITPLNPTWPGLKAVPPRVRALSGDSGSMIRTTC
ncbi:hypothetical protein [Streptomyces sp. Ag109_O5-10]|uniref:hypothetical protein n=1 Tax=Streptomyces sp. Ag109_O5-10 TaxID=1855349 RepID=UPI00210B9C29|nr:hypothetical protein [Streptomyces sp. Ag109_O5-10]